MNEKRGFFAKAEQFVAGKGFYIVLLACAVVIALSLWIVRMVEFSENADELLDSGVITAGIPDSSETTELKPDISQETFGPDTEIPEQIESAELETETEEVGKPEIPEAGILKPEEVSKEDPLTKLPEKPVFIRPVSGKISLDYAVDALIYSKTMGDWRTHDGIDIEAQLGTKVFAAAAGTVSEIYEDDMLGTTVIIDHGNGLKSIYANLAAIPTVQVGDTVLGGDVIGAVGSTALGETGEVSHLHFAMTLNDNPVDPTEYLPL